MDKFIIRKRQKVNMRSGSLIHKGVIEISQKTKQEKQHNIKS